MATVAYPSNIAPMQISKTRSHTPTFKLLEPTAGAAYVKHTSIDAPITYSATFKFSEADAQKFWVWYYSPLYCNRGRNKFTMPIKTEFGLIEHECQFIPDSLMDLSQDVGIYEYSATLMIREMPIPAEILAAQEFILLGDWWDYRAEFDIAVNRTWPEA